MATIAVIMAMRAEAGPLIDEIAAARYELTPSLPTQVFVAERSGDTTVIGVNGIDPDHQVDLVGTEPAVLTTMQVIEHWQPDVVISAGTAGGWSRSAAQIGDVFVAWPHVVRHDRRIEIEGFRNYGIGRHLVWAYSEELAQHLDARKGVVTTSNSLDESE
ncbi:MAG: hypothetical protein VXW34_03735, partial [Actinomycetota bacterium]|nr:hypothetical protein [Actinomycetota bacterium]